MTLRRPSSRFPRTRVALLGDHRLYRSGLRGLLEAIDNVTVMRDLALTPEALATAKQLSPDVAIVDSGGNTHQCLAMLEHLVRELAGIPLVIIAEQDCPHCIQALTRFGVHALVSPDASGEELAQALRCARRDERYVSDGLTVVAGSVKKTSSPVFDRLSPRQRQILGFIGRGLGVREIAGRLGISPKTVETHRMRIQKLLGLADAKALMVYAVRLVHAHPLISIEDKKQVRHSPTSGAAKH